MSATVRVRFAPSPTGPLHIGGVRTALYNYLFAKKHNGTFVLRIEDTDQNRFVEGAEDYIIESLNWCGIPFDEGPGKEGEYGPYRQSQRKHLYREYAQKLIDQGKAYHAFDSNETLDYHRRDHEQKGKTFIYNWHNRLKLSNSLSLTEEETLEKLNSGDAYVIRFKSPENELLHFSDVIRGDMEVNTNVLDDKVLFKSDGMPTYHLANIVDDHLMKITHVIRGEEWLPSLALHHQLYEAFGWKPPLFAHLPLILKPTGKGKLSKRDGDKLGFPVFPLQWKDPKDGSISKGYKDEGYFPEAVTNFLAFLGWNPGTEQEFFNLTELTDAFEIDKVHKAGARFDPDKTKWFNHHYMQTQKVEDLAKVFQSTRNELQNIDLDYIELVVELIRERATFVDDFWELSHYFFVSPAEYDDKAYKKVVKPDTAEILNKIKSLLSHCSDFTVASLKAEFTEWIKNENLGFGKVMMPLRLALVGSLQGPDVFEIMFLIGKNESLQRINALLLEV